MVVVGVLLIVAEAMIIVMLLLFPVRVSVRARRSLQEMNPIRNAIWYDSSARRFEEIAALCTNWINVAPLDYEADRPPVLAECASLNWTGRVEILLKHGARVDDSIMWLRKHGYEDGVRLIGERLDAASCGQPRAVTNADRGLTSQLPVRP